MAAVSGKLDTTYNRETENPHLYGDLDYRPNSRCVGCAKPFENSDRIIRVSNVIESNLHAAFCNYWSPLWHTACFDQCPSKFLHPGKKMTAFNPDDFFGGVLNNPKYRPEPAEKPNSAELNASLAPKDQKTNPGNCSESDLKYEIAFRSSIKIICQKFQ